MFWVAVPEKTVVPVTEANEPPVFEKVPFTSSVPESSEIDPAESVKVDWAFRCPLESVTAHPRWWSRRSA
jgi:hypothetical protein